MKNMKKLIYFVLIATLLLVLDRMRRKGRLGFHRRIHFHGKGYRCSGEKPSKRTIRT